jgi:hypothetical protein
MPYHLSSLCLVSFFLSFTLHAASLTCSFFFCFRHEKTSDYFTVEMGKWAYLF